MKHSTRRRKAAPATTGDQIELQFETPPAGSSLAEMEFGPLDVRFAELMVRLNGVANPTLWNAARVVSAARGAGESCVPLGQLGAGSDVRRQLLEAKVVGTPGEWRPLIVDAADRLYLQRYWEYEQRLAAAIAERLAGAPRAIDEKFVEEEIARWIDNDAADQRRAVQVALRSSFTVITGGPGTGKTRTVAVILALLEKLADAAGEPPPRIALAAPTGKAAMRLQESIRHVREKLEPDAAARPVNAVTLHRLLGLFGASPRPRHDARHPLTAEVVIVDEASMVDLAMMAKLFAAVPRTARLILLGDRDQLPPVETGHVLGDICSADAPALRGHIVALRKNFRFAPESGIKVLSEQVQAGDTERVLQTLATGVHADLSAAEVPAPDQLRHRLESIVKEGFGPVLAHLQDAAAALEALGNFRILCGLREGPYGVENLNRLVETVLAAQGRIQLGARHYSGRPVMVLRNDYQLRLFNGDIGLVLPDPASGGELRAFFRAEDGALRRLSPARLPEHETAWAMTVHKSQGSEFRKVLLILPDRENAVVTRELIYTAITRAREAVQLWYRPEPLREVLRHQTVRASGLGDAIRANCAQGPQSGSTNHTNDTNG
jgi:exodeoxyribonuclease V alpha subunit